MNLFDTETLFPVTAPTGPRVAPPGEYAMVRATDPVTSLLAAQKASVNAATLRARCLETLRAHPAGLTDFELADVIGSQQTSAGKRRGELVAQGLVCNSGLRRPSPSGSPSIVWKAVH